MVQKLSVAVLGAGNGGLALAGVLSLAGHDVRLWNRSHARIQSVISSEGITLNGNISGKSQPVLCTTEIATATAGCSLIMVATIANAHARLAHRLKPMLESDQVILLNPGRTGGALEMRHILGEVCYRMNVSVAEAESLVYACRATGAEVNIIGTKSEVCVSAFPANDTERVLRLIKPLFQCFTPATNVLQTSFANIGAMFHPTIVLLNAAAIARGSLLYLYRDLPPVTTAFLEELDQERVTAAGAYGISVESIFQWIQKAYPETKGNTLHELMQNCKAYSAIRAPSRLDSRLILEDVPTGLVPLFHLGNAQGVAMPLTRALIDLSGSLLKRDFWKTGRTLESMGLADICFDDIDQYLQTGIDPSHETKEQ